MYLADHSNAIDPEAARSFATDVVRRLREAGFEAYWAGGCVRDLLVGKTPKDYDVATNARPADVRRIFGRRRTLPLGVKFGIITVLGPPRAGQVEVATFRRDSPYSDGRHPDSVTFSDAREDALRRDFTINGLFYDPLEDQVIDYVSGQEDLKKKVLRAIGDPSQRFAEDWLRMLRAARFAAAYELTPDPETAAAIQQLADKISGISPERISAEVLRILTDRHRKRGVSLLREWGLLAQILPESQRLTDDAEWQVVLDVLDRLVEPDEATALAALVEQLVPPDTPRAFMRRLAKRWRLSNRTRDEATWELESLRLIDQLPHVPWSRLQPILVHDHIDCLLHLAQARWETQRRDLQPLAELHTKLKLPRAELDPPPLVTGDDLVAEGMRPGPGFRHLLESIRAAQLDGKIKSKEDALQLARTLWQQAQNHRPTPSNDQDRGSSPDG